VIRGLRVPVHLTSRETLRMFNLADIWAARTGHDVRLVSANDHIHSRGSAHYAGLALDFHSSDPDALCEVFRRAGYRVLWDVPGHYAHLHVEQAAPDAVAYRSRPVPNPVLRQASERRSRPGPALTDGPVGREARNSGERSSLRQQGRP
jgi:hypothetical protein